MQSLIIELGQVAYYSLGWLRGWLGSNCNWLGLVVYVWSAVSDG